MIGWELDLALDPNHELMQLATEIPWTATRFEGKVDDDGPIRDLVPLGAHTAGSRGNSPEPRQVAGCLGSIAAVCRKLRYRSSLGS